MKLSLKACRVNSGYTAEEVADKLGVSRQTVWAWESGRTNPPKLYKKALSEIYNVKQKDIIF